MAHRTYDDIAPIDVRIASGLKRAFALPHGNDNMFRPVLDALSHVRVGGEQGPATSHGTRHPVAA